MDKVFSRVQKNKKINKYNYLSPMDKKTLQIQFEKVDFFKKLMFFIIDLFYKQNPFPSNEEVSKLSEDLSQTEQRILNWFKYQWQKKNIRPQHIQVISLIIFQHKLFEFFFFLTEKKEIY